MLKIPYYRGRSSSKNYWLGRSVLPRLSLGFCARLLVLLYQKRVKSGNWGWFDWRWFNLSGTVATSFCQDYALSVTFHISLQIIKLNSNSNKPQEICESFTIPSPILSPSSLSLYHPHYIHYADDLNTPFCRLLRANRPIGKPSVNVVVLYRCEIDARTTSNVLPRGAYGRKEGGEKSLARQDILL